jgi:hypothetical protein
MKHMINLIIGDASGTGHRGTKEVTISSSLTPKELQKAYRAGTSVVGFDLEAVLNEVEQHYLTHLQAARLVELGLPDFLLEENPTYKTRYRIWMDDYVHLWMFVAALGNPRLAWKESEGIDAMCIGGYGLWAV